MGSPHAISIVYTLDDTEDLRVTQVTYTAETSSVGEPYSCLSVGHLSILVETPDQAGQLLLVLEELRTELHDALGRAEVQRQRRQAEAAPS